MTTGIGRPLIFVIKFGGRRSYAGRPVANTSPPMNAIKKARRIIQSMPDEPSSGVLARLVVALESEASFELGLLYGTDLKTFELALEMLRDWRIDRYYLGKMKLIDIARHHDELSATPR